MTRIFARGIADQKGYNLIEAAIVLGIAGLVVGAVFAAWGAVSSQNKLRRAQDQITVIVNQVRSTYGNRSQVDNVTGPVFTNALLNAGLVPDSWVVNNTTLALGNPYGGNIVVTPDYTVTSSVKDAFTISMAGINKVDCYKLVSNMLGAGRTQGLYKVNSVTVNNNSTFQSVKGSVCSTANIAFTFALKSGQ